MEPNKVSKELRLNKEIQEDFVKYVTGKAKILPGYPRVPTR